jgi:hypothetical protein
VFYLGTHMPNWLATLDVPLFVSHRRLRKRKTFPQAVGRWALDSGAFTELQTYGEWRTTEADYVAAVRRYRNEIGGMDWAAPMDWMCEPFMLERTGLTVAEHQQRTVANVLRLRTMAADLPIVPVLQGWTADDYLRHWETYAKAGIMLEDERIVGVGSVCRRQATDEAVDIFQRLRPLRLHGFGVKLAGVERLTPHMTSCDSMAWSYAARRASPLPGHTHQNCANCPDYALIWRGRVIARMTNNNHHGRATMATTYVVLLQQISEDTKTATFTVEAEHEALTADQACKAAAEAMSDHELGSGVTLVAVPARSWKYVKVQAETQRRLKVSS